MKKVMKLLPLFLCAMLVVLAMSCNDDEDKIDEKRIPASISGLVEKGPFVAGSKVDVAELDKNMQSTGKNFNTTISSDDGAFNLLFNDGLNSEFVEVSVTGYYYNEVRGSLSDGTITLSALADVTSAEITNVNLLTHLEKKRVEHLVSNGSSFANAKNTAQKELLAVFGIDELEDASETISIVNGSETGNILMAISCILQGSSSEAAFTEQLQWFISDFEKDGVISDKRITEAIKTNSAELKYDLTSIKSALTQRYATLGKTIIPGDFENYIDFDGNGILYKDEDKEVINTEKQIKVLLNEVGQLTSELMQHMAYFDALYVNLQQPDENEDNHWQLVYNHNVTASNKQVEEIWNHAYDVIYKANSVLTSLSSNLLELSEETGKEYKGEAHMYRAYAYLILTQWFGDVPLDLRGSDDILLSPIPVSQRKEVTEQVIDDLLEAKQMLPESGYNHQLIELLLARSYMFSANYSEATALIENVVNTYDYKIGTEVEWIPTIYNLEGNDDVVLILSTKTLFDELYLYLAECKAQMGDMVTAIEYINRIESFYKWDVNSDGVFNDDDLSTNIDGLIGVWRNYRSGWWNFEEDGELYSEEMRVPGQQMPVHIRLNKAVSILGIAEHQKLLPIPQSALASNPNLMQNPGY